MVTNFIPDSVYNFFTFTWLCFYKDSLRGLLSQKELLWKNHYLWILSLVFVVFHNVLKQWQLCVFQNRSAGVTIFHRESVPHHLLKYSLSKINKLFLFSKKSNADRKLAKNYAEWFSRTINSSFMQVNDKVLKSNMNYSNKLSSNKARSSSNMAEAKIL